MRCINLTHLEAKTFPSTLLRISPEQPPKGYTFHGIDCTSVAFRSNTPANMDIWSTKLPFSVGDVVGCKYKGKLIGKLKIESVDVKRVQEMSYKEVLKLGIDEDKYTAIKKRWTNCVIGQDKGFADHFNSLYAKPRPIKEQGKIVSYVCYLYSPKDGEWFIEKYAKYMQSTCDSALSGFTYKGLPLTIHANLYIMLTGGKEIKP